MDKMGRLTAGLLFAAAMVIGTNARAEDDAAGKVDEGVKKHASREPVDVFKRWDANADGKVSKDEFFAAREASAKKRSSAAPSKENLAKRFAEMDGDSDGFLTLDEMKASFAKGREHGEGHGDKEHAPDGKTGDAAGKE
jgi:hypothetical protein